MKRTKKALALLLLALLTCMPITSKAGLEKSILLSPFRKFGKLENFDQAGIVAGLSAIALFLVSYSRLQAKPADADNFDQECYFTDCIRLLSSGKIKEARSKLNEWCSKYIIGRKLSFRDIEEQETIEELTENGDKIISGKKKKDKEVKSKPRGFMGKIDAFFQTLDPLAKRAKDITEIATTMGLILLVKQLVQNK